MHASMLFDAKCFTRGCSLSKRIVGSFHRVHSKLAGGLVLIRTILPLGDTVLSLYLSLELLKYRILLRRDRFLRVNDTKIVYRPRGLLMLCTYFT